ncbi:MAG TPA: YggT family protein [Anaerolineaceae bacterium]|nr:YggT family protein [Anaerolineaceae bacterium]
MAFILIRIIDVLATLLIILIFAQVILSYFMSPYHRIRYTVDRIVDPMLTPIRRVVRPIGGFDLSPLILLILIQVVEAILKQLVISLLI